MGDLVRSVMGEGGIKGIFPYASTLYLFCRGRDIYLTYSHDISVVFASDADDRHFGGIHWGGEDGYKIRLKPTN